jgi:hypothetical protein
MEDILDAKRDRRRLEYLVERNRIGAAPGQRVGESRQFLRMALVGDLKSSTIQASPFANTSMRSFASPVFGPRAVYVSWPRLPSA